MKLGSVQNVFLTGLINVIAVFGKRVNILQKVRNMLENIDPNDFHNYLLLGSNERYLLDIWVSLVIQPYKRYNIETSYGLKHEYTRDSGIYVNNGCMKGCLLQAGYEPDFYKDQNWCFCIQPTYIWPKHRKVNGIHLPPGYSDDGNWSGLFRIPDDKLQEFKNAVSLLG